MNSQVVDFALQKMQISLHSQNYMELQGKVQLIENDHNRLLGFTAMLRPRTHSYPIILESFNCTQGEGISLDLIVSLTQKFQELTNLPYFQLEDISLRIKSMEIQQGRLILLIEANVNQIPDSVTQLLD